MPWDTLPWYSTSHDFSIFQHFDCENYIDEVTLGWYLSTNAFNAVRKKIVDDTLKSHPFWSWCPSRRCAVKLEDPQGGSLDVTCLCDDHWCFLCKEKAHWPAKCSHVQKYNSELKRLGQSVFQPPFDEDQCLPWFINPWFFHRIVQL